MAYQPADRSFSPEYLRLQHGAMRWLHDNGFTYEEIQQFHLGNVNEGRKVVVASQCNLGRAIHMAFHGGGIKPRLEVSVVGSRFEWFFLKSRFISGWMFTREKPRSWRREVARASLYSIKEIKIICDRDQTEAKRPRLALTKPLVFGTIKVSKLNITNLKPEGVKSDG